MKLRWREGGYTRGWRKGGRGNDANTVYIYEIIKFNFKRILMLLRREAQCVEFQECGLSLVTHRVRAQHISISSYLFLSLTLT